MPSLVTKLAWQHCRDRARAISASRRFHTDARRGAPATRRAAAISSCPARLPPVGGWRTPPLVAPLCLPSCAAVVGEPKRNAILGAEVFSLGLELGNDGGVRANPDI